MERLRLWEQALRVHIANVELLGEIPITAEEARILARNITQVYERAESYSLAYKILTRNYPTALAVMLVAQGIYTYVAGDYWSQVHRALEIELPPQHQRQLGQFFLEFLKQRGLPTFALDEGHRYVTPILLHAGIPNDILSDYFDWFLRRSLNQAAIRGLESADLITEWLRRSSSDLVQKPVRRFLQYGGKVAEDFVARTIAFAEIYQTQGVEAARTHIHLPQRISDALETWMEQLDSPTLSQRPRNQLRTPVIVIDPWGDTPFVEFPKQLLPDDELISSCTWTIDADHQEVFRTELHPIHVESGILLESLAADIPPASQYLITFQAGSSFTRTWHFDGISTAHPFAVFDARTQNLITRHAGIPAREVFFIFDAQMELTCDGGRRLETFQRPSQAWQDYKVERWDLHEAQAVHFDEQTFAVAADNEALQPYLLGESVDTDSGMEAPCAIFCERPPDIMIPIPPLRTAEQEAVRWRVQLQYNEHDICHGSLQDLPHYIEDGCLRVALTLPHNVCGEFTLSLRGPLGRDITFTFGILPYCQIDQRPALRFPSEQDVVPPGDFKITIPSPYTLSSIDARCVVETTDGSDAYQVRVPAEMTHAKLQIEIPATNWRFAFTIVLPVIQWSFIDDTQQYHEVVWQSHRITVPQIAIEQAQAPGLLVRTSAGAQGRSFQVRYEYTPDQVPQVVHEQRRSRMYWLFPLAQLKDTLRRQAQNISRIHVCCDAATTPALFITQDASITVTFLDNCLVDGRWILSVKWSEERHFHQRLLLLWSLTRPWEQPYKLQIHDSADGIADWELPHQGLPPGNYRVGIIVRDPWTTHVPSIPPRDARYVRDVQLGTQAEARKHVSSISPTLRGLFERLLSADTEEQQAAELRLIKRLFHPREISETLQTFLALQERTDGGLAATQTLQQLLRSYPIEALITAIEQGRASLDSGQRRRYEEALWVLDKRLGRLLTQFHRDSTLSFASALDLIDAGRAKDADARREIQRLLEDKGIRLTDTHTSDTPIEDDNEEDDTSSVPDTLTWYLRQIAQYKLLNSEEERILAEQIDEGRRCQKELETTQSISPVRREMLLAGVAQGQEAREHMILSNLRLVVNIASQKSARGMELLERIQEGAIGLCRAVNKFDVSRGFRFSTHATWWIRQAISRAKYDQSRAIRLPAYVWTEINRIHRAESTLRNDLGHEPSDDEITTLLQMAPGELANWRIHDEQTKYITSLDMPTDDEGDTTLVELIPDDGEAQDHEDQIARRAYIQFLMSDLTAREQMVLRLRFGVTFDNESNSEDAGQVTDHTLEEVGRILHVTRERIRQIEDRALEKMRSFARKISPEDFASLPQPENKVLASAESRKVITVHGTQKRGRPPKITPTPKTTSRHGTVIGHYLWDVQS